MSPKFLVGTVGSELLIKSDDSCRDLVDEAKNYLLLPQERPLMQGPRTRPRKPIRCGEVLFAGTLYIDVLMLLVVMYVLVIVGVCLLTVQPPPQRGPHEMLLNAWDTVIHTLSVQ